MVSRKLFPKKDKSKVETEARLKMSIHKLNLKAKEYNRKSRESRLRALKALKRGDKVLAKQHLIKEKIYKEKVQKYYNLISRIERHLDALEEAKTIQDVSTAMESSSKELSHIAENVNPEKSLEIVNEADESIEMINNSMELLAGDLELDSGIDVEDELDQLETEMIMQDAAQMPQIPSDLSDEEYVDEDMEADATVDIKPREKINEELKKMKKELGI
ncbi:MAG: Snf7 family protein [Promethearchaeota archaeon]